MAEQLKFICRDCYFESEYDDMAAHVRAEHDREPSSGPTLKVGDEFVMNYINYRVAELLENGKVMAQPLSISVQYRVAEERWGD